MGRKKLDETAELKRETVVGSEEESETPDHEKLAMVP